MHFLSLTTFTLSYDVSGVKITTIFYSLKQTCTYPRLWGYRGLTYMAYVEIYTHSLSQNFKQVYFR